MITKFEKYQLITEDPDSVGRSRWTDRDAKPFFTKVNKDHTDVKRLFIGRYGSAHSDMKWWSNDEFDREENAKCYPGRIWVKDKIISFWVYPNEKLFVSIIRRLEKKLKIKIFDNNWKIEIIKKKGQIKRRKFDQDKEFKQRDDYRNKEKLIPIEDYAGSENPSQQQKLWHLMNAEEKRIAKLKGEAPDFRGWGSDMTAWDGPRPLPYRQAIYQENKIIK